MSVLKHNAGPSTRGRNALQAREAVIWLPDAPPASPNALDIEWYTKSALPAGWSEYDATSKQAVSFDSRRGLILTQSQLTDSLLTGVGRSIPVGDLSAWGPVNPGGVIAAGEAPEFHSGLILYEDITDQTKKLFIAGAWSDIGSDRATGIELGAMADNTSFPSFTFISRPRTKYVRFRRNGSDWYVDAGDDEGGTTSLALSLTFTPTSIGQYIMRFAGGSASYGIGMFRFFRWMSSDVGPTALFAGALVGFNYAP